MGHHGAILLFIFSLFMNETYVDFGWDIEIRTNSIVFFWKYRIPKTMGFTTKIV